MIEYHEPGFVCCNSLNPCEKHEKKPPAQSDAPSAERFWTRDYNDDADFLQYYIDDGQRECIFKFAEAYAAIRTAKFREEIQGLEDEGDDILRAFNKVNAELISESAKIAQLERERDLHVGAYEQVQSHLGFSEEDIKKACHLETLGAITDLRDAKVAAESALSEARAQTIKELIEVAEISAKLLAEQEAEIAKALPNADGFVAGGVAMATRLAEGFRKLLAGKGGADAV